MRLLIITQDDPFYLSESLKNLINLTPKKHLIVGIGINITKSPSLITISVYLKGEILFNSVSKIRKYPVISLLHAWAENVERTNRISLCTLIIVIKVA